MVTKDWILLLVPIVSNGIIIFIVQFFLNRKFKRIEQTDKRRSIVVDKYLEMIFDSLEVVSEAEKRFKFREDMTEINNEFKIKISELCRYGKNMECVLHLNDELEELHAKGGFCLARLNEYQKLGKERPSIYPMEEQQVIINYLIEIKGLIKKQYKKCIRL